MTRTLNPDVPDGATPGGRCGHTGRGGADGIRTYLLAGTRYHSDDQTECTHPAGLTQTGANAIPGVTQP